MAITDFNDPEIDHHVEFVAEINSNLLGSGPLCVQENDFQESKNASLDEHVEPLI